MSCPQQAIDIRVFCDFDGTVTRQDSLPLILRHFAGERPWALNEAWLRGEMGTAERARGQFGEMELREEELARLVEQEIELDPHFPSFVRFCGARGYKLTIVSDGFDFIIERVLAREGLADLAYIANQLWFRDNCIELEFLHQHGECRLCGNCKKWVLEQARRDGGLLVYIGDGFSDRCAAEVADLTFAKGGLAAYCREHHIPHIGFADFSEVQEELRARFGEVFPGESGLP